MVDHGLPGACIVCNVQLRDPTHFDINIWVLIAMLVRFNLDFALNAASHHTSASGKHMNQAQNRDAVDLPDSFNLAGLPRHEQPHD